MSGYFYYKEQLKELFTKKLSNFHMSTFSSFSNEEYRADIPTLQVR